MGKYKMSYRGTVRLIAFSAALLTVACVSFVCAEGQKAETKKAKQTVEYSYQKSLAELAAYVDNLSVSLEKALCSGTEEGRAVQAAKVWREAAAAKACLSSLPATNGKLENTNKFLSQVGEYAYALTRRTAEGEPITVKEGETVKELSRYAQSLKDELYDMLDNAESGFSLAAWTEDDVQSEESYESYPTLIYDGPFSDHLYVGEQKAIAGKSEISERQASLLASAFSNGIFTSCSGKREGTLPVYIFEKGDYYLELTKKGGCVLTFVHNRTVNETRHTAEEAVAAAETALREYGLPDMAATYTLESDNTLLINFAYSLNGTVCYPDLIKIRIALDDLSVLGVEASGYLASHTSREKPETVIGITEAKKSVSSALKINRVQTAFICPNGLTEYFVYEFAGVTETGREVLCYIDAKTGREVDLLLLLSTPGGKLTV